MTAKPQPQRRLYRDSVPVARTMMDEHVE